MDRATKWLLGISFGALAAGLGFWAVRSRAEETTDEGDEGDGEEPAPNLFATHEDFIRRLWDALTSVAPTLGTYQKTVLIAQAIHEASWGAARASREGRNYWNLTAGPSWTGATLSAPDLEYTPGEPKPKKISATFRAYSSDEDAVRDFLRFIGPGSRYAEAWGALQTGDALGYVAKLRERGFFTQPLNLYQNAVTKYVQTVVQTLG